VLTRLNIINARAGCRARVPLGSGLVELGRCRRRSRSSSSPRKAVGVLLPPLLAGLPTTATEIKLFGKP